MKKRIYLFSLLFFALVPLHAQSSLWVNCMNGTQKEMLLSDLNKLFFNEESVVFTHTSGEEDNFLMTEIRTLTFVQMSYGDSNDSGKGPDEGNTDISGGTDDDSDSSDDGTNTGGVDDSANSVSNVDEEMLYRLETNPVEEWFVLHGHGGEMDLVIFSADGCLVKHSLITPGRPVYVGQLSKGLYILKMGGQTLKMLKK